MNRDLTTLGDSLERAVAIDIDARRNISPSARHPLTDHTTVIEEDSMLASNQTHGAESARPATTRRRSRRVVVIGAFAILGIGGAAAAAAVTMSSDDVSHGLPGGSMIFQGTKPTCSSTDGVVFQCTLASAPTAEVLNDYTGAAELFVDKDLHIAGGCRGRSADGLEWTCYLGQRAVDEGILASDLLGQYEPTPGRG